MVEKSWKMIENGGKWWILGQLLAVEIHQNTYEFNGIYWKSKLHTVYVSVLWLYNINVSAFTISNRLFIYCLKWRLGAENGLLPLDAETTESPFSLEKICPVDM